MNEGCKCKEIKEIANALVQYLSSIQECILKSDPILEKDHKDIKDLLSKAKEILQ